MGRIEEVFCRLRKEGKKALIPYVTAGDPNLKKTYELLSFLSENGADLVEVGVPFSDPMADGVVIQRAMERALRGKTDLKNIFEMLKDFRKHHEIPIILMGYANTFFAYGFERFAEMSQKVGIDGVLTVDLPPEEAEELFLPLKKRAIPSIFLATPTTDERRARVIKRYAKGFLYFVSVTGVTGEREELSKDILERIEFLKNLIKIPVVLGFGISKGKIIEEFYPYVDGFVVGSSLIRRWEEAGFKIDFSLRSFFGEIEKACHKGS